MPSLVRTICPTVATRRLAPIRSCVSFVSFGLAFSAWRWWAMCKKNQMYCCFGIDHGMASERWKSFYGRHLKSKWFIKHHIRTLHDSSMTFLDDQGNMLRAWTLHVPLHYVGRSSHIEGSLDNIDHVSLAGLILGLYMFNSISALATEMLVQMSM